MAFKVKFPVDGNNVPASPSVTPSKKATAVTNNGSIGSSVQVNFNTATTFLEISAVGAGIFLNWGTTAASTTVFDAFIQSGNTRFFFLPPGTTAANFIQQAATATLILVEK